MRKALPLTPLMALGLVTALSAQTVQTLPQGYLTTNGNQANSWPWNNTSTTGHRCMWIYDSSHFKSVGPILIQKLRWRTYSTYSTWAGGTHPNITINLSTSPVDYKNASPTFANNHGNDVAAVFKGTATVTPSTHANGRWYAEIVLKTPFLYDPSKGDLTIDYIRPAGVSGSFVPVDTLSDNTSTWSTKSNRIQSYNSATSATGSVGPYAAIVEVTWLPAKGLYSAFTADKTSGPGPLTVQFTDKTYSSAGPVKSWAWDFDGDNKIDSNLQNPKWTYPKTTWDATYDVSLTTSDGTHPASKKTEKAFITVDPSDAFAVNFGTGSSNKPLPVPIELPPNASIYSATAGIRGYFFVAPTTFVINGFEAPNDYSPKESDQTVVCYVMTKAPTGAYAATAADVKFFGTGKANTVLKPTSPIIVTKGQWVGVLGACHASTAASPFRNSYATGSYKSSVLGQPITLNRLWMNSDARTNKGLGTINPSTGSLARVFIHVAGNVAVPTMETIGAPQLGKSAQLDLVGRVPAAQTGIVLMSAGRLPAPVPTMFGNLLITPAIAATFAIPGGTGKLTLPVPNDNNLKGVKLDFQALVVNLLTKTYGMSNGCEWFLGK